MVTALELVYQYRHLLGKCDAGVGLTIDEIEALQAIRALFSHHKEWEVEIAADLRSNHLIDRVRIASVSPLEMVVRRAPYTESGQTVEIVIADPELSVTYRFKAVVAWRGDDAEDDYVLGLTLVGSPVLVRHHRHITPSRAVVAVAA